MLGKSSGRPASRLGDADMPHSLPCTIPMFRSMGSPNVLINGRPASIQFDFNNLHIINCSCPPCCCPHIGAIAVGSPTVRINGRGAGRLGDALDNGCTFVAMGSPNVLVGP
tara:strand:+ start:198 stop:530 length:333 start_codon:yes stop_codon:yes gene_type:complete